MALGHVGLPGDRVTSLVRTLGRMAPESLNQPQVRSVLDALGEAGGRPGGREQNAPLLKLADGRRIRLMSVRLGEGVIDLTAQTLDHKSAE